MKRKITFSICFAFLLTMLMGLSVCAAGATMTINGCIIQGGSVVVTAGGSAASEDGNLYLFALQPYEAGIGARTDYCAAVPAAPAVTMTTDLNLNSAASKLYARFVIAAKQGGSFVPVSNEYYITNPEAVATHTINAPARAKKGVTLDWRYAKDLSDLGCGYALYELDPARFTAAGGVNYTYNGKNYSFNSVVVTEFDQIAKMCQQNGVHVIMACKLTFKTPAADLIAPAARVPGMRGYAWNVDEQGGAEKIQALMHFLAERYSDQGNGQVHSWIIGNEVNNNNNWHWSGSRTVADFSAHYAKEVRMCYNAIKSANANAKVYINLDQRWMFEDGTHDQYGGKKVLDAFAASISSTGNIDWGLSFHPHCLPLNNAQFWNIPANYRAMNLVNNTENSKMVIPTNVSVMTNYMTKPEMLNPAGGIRNVIISEMLFSSANPTYATNEQIQAAAMTYAYKLMAAQPVIQAVIIHRHVDDASEIADAGMACGLRNADGSPKFAYNMFKVMDTGDTSALLPIIGASSWAQLGVQ